MLFNIENDNDINNKINSLYLFNDEKKVNHFLSTSDEPDNQLISFENCLWSPFAFQNGNELDNSFDQSRYFVQKKPSDNSEEKNSKKKTSPTSENGILISKNNIQISQDTSPEVPINFPNSKNITNTNKLNTNNIQNISMKKCKFISIRENSKKDEINSNFEKGKIFLTGEGGNTKVLEKKLNEVENSNNSEKKEKANLQVNKKNFFQVKTCETANEKIFPNQNELKLKDTQETGLENHEFISFKEINNKYEINIKFEKLRHKKLIEKDQLNYLKIIKKENFLCNKRKNNNEIEEVKEKEKIETKKGRKKNGDDSGKHKKTSDDNMMYGIKSNLNNWLRNLINKYLPKNQKLLKIDFQVFSKIINVEKNREFLKMTLAEIFSQNISPIYSKIITENGAKYNKKIIDEIMKSNNEKAKSLLQITYKEGLDLYRFKENETNLKQVLGNEIINEIKGRVDEFLYEIFEKEKEKIGEREADDYVSSLLVMVYNYERWFFLKTPKIKKEVFIEIEINEN